MSAARSGAAFDAIAAEYDAVFSRSLIGAAQRQAVWSVLDRAFTPGQRVLEINCGTGTDAMHLAQNGVRVHACDSSPAMIDVASRRLRDFADVTLERRATEDLSDLTGCYDGLVSNFGGLNCLEDPAAALRRLKRLVRSGGHAILCYMGPLCAWELLWYFAHRQPRKALRRLRRSGVTARIGNGQEFRVHYPAVNAVVRAFAPEFRLVQQVGIGVFVPPSYAELFARDHRRALDFAIRLDRRFASWPVFRDLADHVLLHFQKVSE